MKSKKNLMPLEDFIHEEFEKKDTPKRDKFENGFEAIKIGYLIHKARLEKGLTQEELAPILTYKTQ